MKATKPLCLVAMVALGAATGCAHHTPRRHATVSATTNEELVGDRSHRQKHRMSYSIVDDSDALNHDANSREHQAMMERIERDRQLRPATSQTELEDADATR